MGNEKSLAGDCFDKITRFGRFVVTVAGDLQQRDIEQRFNGPGIGNFITEMNKQCGTGAVKQCQGRKVITMRIGNDHNSH
jgi:hypothetical protein